MATTIFSTSIVSNSDFPIFTYEASGDRVIVNAGVTLSKVGDALSILYAPGYDLGTGLRDLQATINGTLSAPGGFGIYALGSSIDLTVGRTGRILAEAGEAIRGSHDSSVANHGVLSGVVGVEVVDVTYSTVENWGAIRGSSVAIEFNSLNSTGTATVLNHGTVQAGGGSAIYSEADTTVIINDGTIRSSSQNFASAIDIRDRGAPGPADDKVTILNTGMIQSDHSFAISAKESKGATIVNEGTIRGELVAIALSYAGADAVTNDGLIVGQIRFSGGDDTYHGENGRIHGDVWGQGGDDRLVGGIYADVLSGGSGDDTLTGNAGADRLTGSTGADVLSGGTGDDVFRFVTAGESLGDLIRGYAGTPAFAGVGIAGGDRIDVSAIDANENVAGTQHFVFGTSQDVGHLWAVDVGGVTHILGNVAGDATPEFDLAINDKAGVAASDYASGDFIL